MSSHRNSTSTIPEVDPSPTTNTYTGRSVVTPGGAALMLLATLFVVFFVIIVLYFRAQYSRAGTIDEHFPARPLVLFAPDHSPTARAPPRRHRRRPLDPPILKALPVSVFPCEDFKLKGPAGVECCAVCLSEFADGDEARVLPRCGHGFHVDCIDMWFLSNSTCPLCRLPVALASSSVEPTACAEVVSSNCKIVDPEGTCVVNVNIDEGSSSPSPNPSLSRGSDMPVGACSGSRGTGTDIEEGVLGVPVPNSSV